MKRKRILFWLVLALFVAGSIRWIFCFPYDAKSVCRAAPDDAVFISRHKALSGRWRVLARNPLTLSVLACTGADANSFLAAIGQPSTAGLIDRYARRDTIFAHVPGRESDPEGAWMFASWIGGRGQILRLQLAAGLVSGFRKAAQSNCRTPIWEQELDPRRRFFLAVHEGVLVGCVAGDAVLVQRVLTRLESSAAIVPELQARLREDTSPDPNARVGQDEGWVAWNGAGVRFALSSVTQRSVEGRMTFDRRVLPPSSPSSADWRNVADPAGPAGERGLSGLLGDAPCLFVAFPAGYAGDQYMRELGAPKIARVAVDFLRENAEEDGPAWLALLGEEYKGKLFGLGAPAFLAGVRRKGSSDLAGMVGKRLDKLSAEQHWTLIPGRAELHGTEVVVLERSARNVLDTLTESGKPAIFEKDGWLVLASDVKSLDKLMGQPRRLDSDPWWLRGMRRGDAVARGCVDLVRAEPVFKSLLDIARLALIMQNAEGYADAALEIDRAKSCLASLRPFNLASVRLLPQQGAGTESEVAFSFGTDSQE